MRNFFLDICEVEKVLKDRFKITPARIEPYFNSSQISIVQGVNQSVRYDWRMDRPYFEVSVGDDSLKHPFFVGTARVMILRIGNDSDVSGFWAGLQMQEIVSISTVYNLDLRQWVYYADGVTYLGPVLPTDNSLEVSYKLNNPHPVIGPWLRLHVFTDATGTVRFYCNVFFEGFRVYMS